MATNDAISEDDFIYEYDVFLSFRGGTRFGFTDHLYNALRQRGIRTYRDDKELGMGDEIETGLYEAIDNSRMSMVVLCKDYASSTWCLNELAKIIDCHDRQGKQVVAIFYKVEPSDVQYQRNSYEAAMTEHENRFGKDSEKIKAWRSALSSVCILDLSREHCTDNMYEPEFIKKIVNDTSAKLPAVPLKIKHVVGFDSRFEQVKLLIDIETNDTVRILEIYGAGGIGKTTFAEELYNKIRHQYEASSFLANVREKSNKSIKGLENLQKTLLSEMGEETETTIGSTFKGGYEIKRRLGRKRVLLVLDDVDSVKQLESLAGGRDWFGSGSRIIITTRDTAVLDKHLMDDVIIEKYKMEELDDRDSLELFCWYAFDKNGPAEKFATVSSLAVSFAKGFPLALEVIGSNLNGKSVEEWEVELNNYRNVPNAKIQGILEISYNSLFELDQKIFLDIACFFKGEGWEYVKRILKACDFFPIIRAFVSKSLMTIDENGCLEMHDLIQDMGKDIVQRQSPSNSGDRSRLWSHDEVLKMLKDDSGSSNIEGILLHPPRNVEVDSWNNTAFKKMSNLRILIVRNTVFSTGPSHLPNSLRLLDWKGYPSVSFSPDFYPQRIVDFKLPHSRLILKTSFQVFEDLTFINLSQCQSITQIPDVSGAKILRVLTLDRCHKLVRFDKSVGFLPKLVHLSASECSMLRSFVPAMYLPSLEVLSFNFCRRLEHFPEVMEEMDKPLKIHMINTAIKKLPKSIGNLIGLEYIDMSICSILKGLSSSLLLLPKLATVIIDGCSQLGESFKRFKKSPSVATRCPNLKNLYFSAANLSDEDLYMIFEIFPKLEYLNVSHNGFASLPKYIKGSLHLKSLDLSYCGNLTEIPELPSSIQKVDARYCPSLTSEASTVLWSKVKRETKRVEVVMPKTVIPNWFDCVGNEGIPLLWARRKFPVVTLALVFRGVNHNDKIQMNMPEFLPGHTPAPSHIVGLHLFTDGQEILRKDYHYFSVGEDHVLLCDVRVLFNEEEWHGLDACLGDDWKAIQVQCESPLILSQWGVHVYKQETNMVDIQFGIPNPNSSQNYMPSSRLVPKRTPQQSKQRIRHVAENYHPREIFGEYMPLLELEENPFFTKVLLRSWRKAKADIREEASASAYGASLKQEHEESPWDVVRIVELMMDNVPNHIADSYSDDIESARGVMEQVLRARVEFMRENGQERLEIDMPIVLEAFRFGEAPSRRYWGRLKIKHDVPAFKAVLRRTNQLAWRFWNRDVSQGRMNIVLLKCQRPCTGEASSSGSGHAESIEEEYNDPVLQELMSRIEGDAMSLNKSYGKMKASIVLAYEHEIVSDEYLMETLLFRAQENLGQAGMSAWGVLEMGLLMFGTMGSGLSPEMLESSFKNTPYGNLRVEPGTTQDQEQDDDVQSTTEDQEQDDLWMEDDVESTDQYQRQQKWDWTQIIRCILCCRRD